MLPPSPKFRDTLTLSRYGRPMPYTLLGRNSDNGGGVQPIDLVYRSARRAPEAVAVCAPGVTLDYRDLVARVDAPAAELPRSAAGKVQRREVRELAARDLA